MKSTLRLYSAVLLLAILIIGGVWIALRHLSATSDVAVSDESRVATTAAVLDSLRSIGQWELASVSCETVIDTTRSRYFGLRHDRLTRRYAGRLSVGIDLRHGGVSAASHAGDTLLITLPAVGLLDTMFLDESQTTVLRSTDKGFERDAPTALAMLARARRRMIVENLSPTLLDDCRRRAEAIITRRLGAKCRVVTGKPAGRGGE